MNPDPMPDFLFSTTLFEEQMRRLSRAGVKQVILSHTQQMIIARWVVLYRHGLGSWTMHEWGSHVTPGDLDKRIWFRYMGVDIVLPHTFGGVNAQSG